MNDDSGGDDVGNGVGDGVDDGDFLLLLSFVGFCDGIGRVMTDMFDNCLRQGTQHLGRRGRRRSR